MEGSGREGFMPRQTLLLKPYFPYGNFLKLPVAERREQCQQKTANYWIVDRAARHDEASLRMPDDRLANTRRWLGSATIGEQSARIIVPGFIQGVLRVCSTIWRRRIHRRSAPSFTRREDGSSRFRQSAVVFPPPCLNA